MRKIFILYISLTISLLTIADPGVDTLKVNARIDSLENVLYNSLGFNLSVDEKISICNKLAVLYTDISYEKQVEYAARSLILAEELGNEELIMQSLEILGGAYLKLDNYEKAIEYNTRLYSIHNTKNNELEAARILRTIGLCYYSWSKYIEAKEYYERALDIFKNNQYFDGIARTLRGLASILRHWGEYDDALLYSQEALKFWEETGDDNGIANSYNSLGVIYQDLGNYDRAHEYYKKSLVLFQKLGQTADIVNMTLHIGDVYLQKELYDKALEYYFKADLIGKQINNKKLKSITLSNIGEAYNLKGNYIIALDYQKKALKLKEDIGDKKRLSITYTELGIIYTNVEDYTKALDYLNKGLTIAEEINFKYQMIKCYKSLSEVYFNIKNYKKAYNYHKLYVEGKEVIYSKESKRTIAELQAKYQVEKKDKDNERLRHSEQLNKVRIRNQQLIIGFVLFVLLGLFSVMVIFHTRYQQNQKLNIQLSLKNKQIEDQQSKVENLNKELKEANKTKDKFFSIVAHDLKSPFNSLLVLTSLLTEDYDTFSEEERKRFILQIKDSSENTFTLLQNLLDWAGTQTGKTIVVKEKIDLSKISKETVALLSPIAKNKKIKLASDINPNTFAYADKNMVSTVLLNLVSNAIKFTPQNGTVEVHSIEKNQHLEIEVADSGIGISSDNLKKIFRLDHKFQTVGTDKEKGTGLGLILCKEFVEKNSGKIWIKSKEGKGSQFYFSLPVS